MKTISCPAVKFRGGPRTYPFTSLFDYFNLMLAMLGGGLAGIFLLAVFTTRAHWIGALVGLFLGTLATAFVQYHPALHVYLAGAAGTVVCVVVGYFVSWLIPLPRVDLRGLTIHIHLANSDGNASGKLPSANGSASISLESAL